MCFGGYLGEIWINWRFSTKPRKICEKLKLCLSQCFLFFLLQDNLVYKQLNCEKYIAKQKLEFEATTLEADRNILARQTNYKKMILYNKKCLIFKIKFLNLKFVVSDFYCFST